MFKRLPLLLALLAIVFGITAAGFLAVTKPHAYGLAAAVFSMLVLLLFVPKTRTFLGYFVFFATLSFTVTAWQDARFNPLHFANQPTSGKQFYAAKIVTPPTFTKKAMRLELALQEVGRQNPQPIRGSIFLYTAQDSAIEKLLPGDDVLFRATIHSSSPPKNPYEFDYQNYMHLHQIYGQAYTTELTTKISEKSSLKRYISKLRGQLFGYMRALHLEPEQEAVAAALLLGNRHLLSDDTQQAFSGSGAMHVLAVSGLHVGILYMLTAMLLGLDRKKPHKNPWQKVLVALAIIWLYAMLTGLSPSVSRAAVMFTFFALGNLAKRKPATTQMLIGSAIFLLIYQPNYLFEVGFQLSYAAVFGIVYLHPKIYHLLPKSRLWLVDNIWQITSVSLAAQASTFALSTYYFHQFPVFFIVSNLVVIPLAWVLMLYGIFLLLASVFFVPFWWLVLPFQWLLWGMTESVHMVESWPNAVIGGLYLSRIELVLLTLLVFFSAEAFWQKKKWALFSSAILAVLLLTSFSADAFLQKNKKQITVYSIPNKTAIEIRNGRNAVLVADENLLADEDAMLFYIRHNLWAGNIKNTQEIDVKKDTATSLHYQHSGILDAFGNRILLLKTPEDTLKIALQPTHILVFKGLKPPKNLPKNAFIILITGHKAETKKLWQNTQKTVHDLEEKGALVIEF